MLPVFACSVLLIVGAPSAHAQLTVNELEVRVALSATADVRTLRVRNEAAERVQAVVTIEDWDRDESGTNRFLPAGSHPRSCASGLDVFPRSLVLEPGESANMRISFTGSPSIASNCWSIVFLENRAAQRSGDRQLNYIVRTGVKVYGEASAARRDGLIDAMTLIGANSDSLSLSFRNVGDVQLAVKGAIEVRRADNSVVHRTELDAFPVLPEQRRRVDAAIPALPKGRYVLLALLDFGGSELVAGQMEYEVR
jgi:P pilus assembly chaperone PapD